MPERDASEEKFEATKTGLRRWIMK